MSEPVSRKQGPWEERFRQARKLLQQRKESDAIELLEPLCDERPQERVARTLLAMAYSRCDRWDDAERMYRSLITDHPDEILLRVRLATLLMQLERDTEARSLLEEAMDEAPDSKELHSTLGVIYMRLGEFREAKRAFEVTGEESLLQALEAKMKEEGVSFDEAPPAEAPPAEAPAKEVVTAEEEAVPAFHDVSSTQDMLEQVSSDDDASLLGQEGGLLLDTNDTLDAVSVHEVITAEHEVPTEVDFDKTPLPLLDELTDVESVEGALPVVVLPPQNDGTDPDPQERLVYVREDVPFVMTPSELSAPPDGALSTRMPLGLSRGENAAPLWIDVASLFGEGEHEFLLLNDGRLLIQVQDKAFVRLRDLSTLIGAPSLNVEHKRFQGKSVGQVFGPKDNPMVCVEGVCQLLLQAQEEGSRSSVRLTNGQVAYFREGTVLAFSASIDWENGRVPSGLDRVEDLSLDQLWGQGEIILQSNGPIWGIPARSGQPVRVAYERLVGWVGELVPQIIPSRDVVSSTASDAFVEFEGEGGVLIASP